MTESCLRPCFRCDRTFEREMKSTEHSIDFYDLFCDGCWNEISQ